MFARRMTPRIALLATLLLSAGGIHAQSSGVDVVGSAVPTADILVAGSDQPSIILTAPTGIGGTRYFKYHFFGSQ